MKKTYGVVLMIMVVSLLTVSCGKKTPEAVAKGFLTAVYNKDIVKAEEFCVEGKTELVPYFVTFIVEVNISKDDFKKMMESISCQIEGEDAACSVDGDYDYDIDLVNQDGEWKVYASK